jgi:hypothetical protein
MAQDSGLLTVVREEWRRRVIAEYGSAAIAHSLTFWLIKLGASPTLLHEGLRIVDDELVHAELSFAVVAATGGANVELAAAGLGLEPEPGLSPLENVALEGVRVFCLGETVAVRLFKRLRQHCSEELARVALDRVLIDEVRHRDFGWLLLEWLSGLPEWPRCQALLQQRLPALFAELRRNYGVVDARPLPFDEALRAWGMMPIREYAAAVLETLERDYVPRFAAYGIDAAAAFGKVERHAQ